VVTPDCGAGGVLGTISTVDFFINDILLTSSTNAMASTAANWQLFTHSFIASTSSTKIAFGNGDGLDDNYNGLDDMKRLSTATRLRSWLSEPTDLAKVRD